MRAAVLFGLCMGAVAADVEGNLIVRKRVHSEDKEGVYASEKNFTVSIDVYNIGDGPAYDVSITDSWPETTSSGTDAFKIVDGSSVAAWEEIAQGAHEQHNFTIVPMFEGRFDGSRATGQYQPTQESESKVVISTAMPSMSVLSAEQYAMYFAKHYQEWAIFSVCSSSFVIVPILAYAYIQSAYTNGVPNAPLKKTQ